MQRVHAGCGRHALAPFAAVISGDYIMPKIGLYKVKQPTKANPRRLVWQMRWTAGGRRWCETIGDAAKITKRDAERARRDKQGKIDNKLIPAARPQPVSLAEYIRSDLEATASDLEAATHLEHGYAYQHAVNALGITALVPADRANQQDERAVQLRKLLSRNGEVTKIDASLQRFGRDAEEIRKRITALGGAVKLGEIGRTEVGRVKNHLKAMGRAPATVRKTVKILSAMFDRAAKDGLIQGNPFKGAVKGKTQGKRKRFFTAEEREAMLVVAPDQWWWVFLMLLFHTGLRTGEALNLQWADIDMNAETLTVARKDAGLFAARGETFPILRWETKTHAERTIELSAELVAALQRFRLTAGGSEYVFLSLDRLRQIDERMQTGRWRPRAELVNNLIRRFRRIQRQARKHLAERKGVELANVPWVIGTLHDCRKTFANEMKVHLPPDDLQRLMGHANIATTMEYYTGSSDADGERKRAAVNAAFGAKTDEQVTSKPESVDSERVPVAKIGLPDTLSA